MRNFDFMRALPEEIRTRCPPEWRHFKFATRPWLAQLYFGDARVHYEVWSLGSRLSVHPEGSLELGLHFESRDRALNRCLLAGVVHYLIEIKADLGAEWEAEAWDKGWAKVYKTIPREPFNSRYLEYVARELAAAIGALQPIMMRLAE
ncbi:MAG: hypothetical protein ACE5FI_00785 [Anaerolineales bacterium]